MTFKVGDRVAQTTTTSSTNDLTLGSALAGFRSFVAGVGIGNETYYCIENGTDWEVGIGTVSLTAPHLTRDTVLASSTGGGKVNFPSGTKNVYSTIPAQIANRGEVAATRSSNFAPALSDWGRVITFDTADLSINLPARATLPVGFYFFYSVQTSMTINHHQKLTINPDGVETINGLTAFYANSPGAGGMIVNGNNGWQLIARNEHSIGAIILHSLGSTTTTLTASTWHSLLHEFGVTPQISEPANAWDATNREFVGYFPGVYHVRGKVRFTDMVAGETIDVRVLVNAAVVFNERTYANEAETDASIETLVELTEGDVVDIEVLHSGAASRTIRVNDLYSNAYFYRVPMWEPKGTL